MNQNIGGQAQNIQGQVNMQGQGQAIIQGHGQVNVLNQGQQNNQVQMQLNQGLLDSQVQGQKIDLQGQNLNNQGQIPNQGQQLNALGQNQLNNQGQLNMQGQQVQGLNQIIDQGQLLHGQGQQLNPDNQQVNGQGQNLINNQNQLNNQGQNNLNLQFQGNNLDQSLEQKKPDAPVGNVHVGQPLVANQQVANQVGNQGADLGKQNVNINDQGDAQIVNAGGNVNVLGNMNNREKRDIGVTEAPRIDVNSNIDTLKGIDNESDKYVVREQNNNVVAEMNQKDIVNVVGHDKEVKAENIPDMQVLSGNVQRDLKQVPVSSVPPQNPVDYIDNMLEGLKQKIVDRGVQTGVVQMDEVPNVDTKQGG